MTFVTDLIGFRGVFGSYYERLVEIKKMLENLVPTHSNTKNVAFRCLICTVIIFSHIISFRLRKTYN